MQKVWFRKSKNAWFATLLEQGRQKQVRLVTAPNTRDGRKLAEAQLVLELSARAVPPEPEGSPDTPACLTVGHILRGFLKHSRQEHAPETAAWYEDLLQGFIQKFGKLRYTRLRKRHVRSWLTGTGYNPTSANKAVGALKRAFNWAVEEEHIPKSPIAHLRKPRPLTRDRTLTPAERELILKAIRGPSFRLFVSALTLTGARPGEVARVTAADVDLDRGLWVLKKHKTAKKTGKPRLIPLCPEAMKLTERLMAEHPEGPLFLNSERKPWTRNAVRIRFRNLRKKHPDLKGIVAYTYRSSFATDALEAGVPDATVAAVLGHTNTATLHKYYARLSTRLGHLKDAAEKAARTASGSGSTGGTPGG